MLVTTMWQDVVIATFRLHNSTQHTTLSIKQSTQFFLRILLKSLLALLGEAVEIEIEIEVAALRKPRVDGLEEPQVECVRVGGVGHLTQENDVGADALAVAPRSDEHVLE